MSVRLTVSANIWSIRTNGADPTEPRRLVAEVVDIAALYITWRRLITDAVIDERQPGRGAGQA